MEIDGQHWFRAPREVVWGFLFDLEALKAAIPGCERLVETRPRSYDLTVRMGIAAIRGVHSAHLLLEDEYPLESFRLVIEGRGPGALKCSALILVVDDGEGTAVRYAGDLRAQGMTARLGSRLLVGTVKLLLGQFFKALEKQVSQRLV